MALLDVSNLSVRFGETQAVADVRFTLDRGERFGLVGESGSGKTLTSLAIAGLLPEGAVAGGTITIDGVALPQDERAMARLRGKRIGMVFQEPMTALNPLMRVARQIEEAVTLNADPHAPQPDVSGLLMEVGLEAKHGARFPHQLSGGQRQRVMIAMALASRPDILIADEPTSALDLITQRRVLDLIDAICSKRQMALLFISHDLKAVGALCQRVGVMHRGRMIEIGDARTVFARPQQAYTQALVAASRFAPAPASRPPVGPTFLEAKGVTRLFRQGGFAPWRSSTPFRAVDGASFSIASAECLALVGPSGCGKTTMAKIIAGLDRLSSGELTLAGTPYHGSDLPRHLRRDISLVFQDPFGSFNPRLTVSQSLAEPLRLQPELSRADVGHKLAEAIEAVGLHPAMLDRYPHEFSGGQRQRLAIARALVTRPRLVILDEPVSALDVSVRGEVLALLASLQASYGLTYLLISHDLDMVAAIADRVLVMQSGRIVEEDTPAEIFAHPQHKQTRDLVAARLPDLV